MLTHTTYKIDSIF